MNTPKLIVVAVVGLALFFWWRSSDDVSQAPGGSPAEKVVEKPAFKEVPEYRGLIVSGPGSSLPDPTRSEFFRDRPVMRFNIGIVDADRLRSAMEPPAGTNIWISFFGEDPIDLVPIKIDVPKRGFFAGESTWTGQVRGEPDSWAHFVINPVGEVSAAVGYSGGKFRIESTGNLTTHYVWEEP